MYQTVSPTSKSQPGNGQRTQPSSPAITLEDNRSGTLSSTAQLRSVKGATNASKFLADNRGSEVSETGKQAMSKPVQLLADKGARLPSSNMSLPVLQNQTANKQPPVTQLYKVRIPGRHFQTIGNMNHLDAMQAELHMEHGARGRLAVRGENFNQYDKGTHADVTQDLQNRRAATLPGNLDARAAAARYQASLTSAFRVQRLYDTYSRINNNATRATIRAQLAANGTNWGAIMNTVRLIINVRLPAAKAAISPSVEHNYKTAAHDLAMFDPIDAALNRIYLDLGRIPRRNQINAHHRPMGTDHSPITNITNAAGAAAPAHNAFDKSDAAVMAELVDLNGIAIPDVAMRGALLDVAKLGPAGLNNPLNDGQIAHPGHKARAGLVGLSHNTRVGAGGYKGRSIWGVYDGRLTLHALAQHGATNKHYQRVAGIAGIPAAWQLV